MTLSVFDAARDCPARIALVWDSGAFDFATLANRVRGALAWLRDRDVTGDASDRALVALEAPPTPETHVMLHALVALGVPFLPLHQSLSREEREDLIATTRASLRIDPTWHLAASPALRDPTPPTVADDERPLAVLPTSGSSGKPQAVVLSRRAFAASARGSAERLGWRDGDRWLLALPLAHVGGLSIVTRCLLGRRAVVLAPAADAEGISSALSAHQVTLLSLVPTQLARLLDAHPTPPPSLRVLLLGGAAPSAALLDRAARQGWPVLCTYGLTEACSQVTMQPLETAGRGLPGAGTALPGTQVRVVAGRIQIRGPSLLSGTLPETPGVLDADGWFSTTDVGQLDPDGHLHVAGRADQVIITGGENVSPTEVESVLESCPGVARACVFGVPDPVWGQRVAAAVILRPGADLSPAALVRPLTARLARFKLPRRMAFVTTLAETASGKVDRAAVARAAEPRLRDLSYPSD